MSSKVKRKKPKTLRGRDRKALFIEAFLANGGNGTEAALAAGYAKAGVATQAFRLLRNAKISAEIEQRRAKVLAEVQEKTGLTIAGVLAELRAIVHSDVRKLVDAEGNLKPLAELDDQTAAAIASIEVDEDYEGSGKDRKLRGFTKKVKFWDKNSALEKAMRTLGQFEKDNKQKADAIGELLGAIHDRAAVQEGHGLQIKHR